VVNLTWAVLHARQHGWAMLLKQERVSVLQDAGVCTLEGCCLHVQNSPRLCAEMARWVV
jgi:hypothetical protein